MNTETYIKNFNFLSKSSLKKHQRLIYIHNQKTKTKKNIDIQFNKQNNKTKLRNNPSEEGLYFLHFKF